MEASMQLKEIDRTLIDVSGANPRKDIKGDSFEELKASVDEHGILEPLIVRPKGKDRYELVAGERRLTAAKELKLEMVPVVIRDLDDAQARVVMLLENLQREELAPLEEAAALEELLKTGMTQQWLGKMISKSQPWVANRLRLLRAPEKLKERLTSGEMTPQHLITVMPYCDREALMGQVFKKFDERREYRGGCSVEELEGIVRSVLTGDDGGRCVFRPDKGEMGYHMEQLAKDMDLSACKDCKKPVVLEDEGYGGKKHKVRVCLETECFRPKVNDARKKVKEREAAALAKDAKSGTVSTDKLRYGIDFKALDYVQFPRSWCKGCPKYHKGASQQRTVTGERHEHICLKPRCLEERVDYHNKESGKVVKRVQSALATAQKAYLKGRSEPLKKHELQYILNKLVHGSPKKLGDLKERDLENLLLSAAVEDEAHSLGYGHVEDKIKEFLGDLPFKLEGDFTMKVPPQPERDPALDGLDLDESGSSKPVPPKAKKVQEKRPKKKGAKA